MLSDLAFRLAGQGCRFLSSLHSSSTRTRAPRFQRTKSSDVCTCTGFRQRRRGAHGLPGRALDYASFHAAAALKLLRLLSRGDVVVAKTDPPLISIAVRG